MPAPAVIPISGTKNAVILHEEDCELQAGKVSAQARCRVVFDITEFPSAVVEIPELTSDLDTGRPVSIRFLDSGFRLDHGTLSGISWDRRPANYPFHLIAQFTEPTRVDRPRKIVSVEALLYNMGRFSFRSAPSRGLDPLELAADHYRVKISPITNDYKSILPNISTPWHRPTNLLTLTIGNNGESAADVETLLFEIRQFLSFAWGWYTGIALARGVDAEGEIAFLHWGMIPPDLFVPSPRSGHWFLPGNAEMLPELFPGYMRRCRDADWKDVVEWALYWWLSANHPGQRAETAILTSVCGLDVLATALERKNLIKPVSRPRSSGRGRGANGSPVARKIRALLTLMKMRLDVGVHLDELRAAAAQHDWDGPEAVAEIRNSLAHPARNGQDGAAYQASQLALWYLEMALLYLFDFKGEGANRSALRRFFFEREKVPWVV